MRTRQSAAGPTRARHAGRPALRSSSAPADPLPRRAQRSRRDSLTADDPARRAALDAGRALRSLAEEWGACAAAPAVAFVLDHPLLASVLIGATAPVQLDDVVAGVALHDQLSDGDRARLRGLVG